MKEDNDLIFSEYGLQGIIVNYVKLYIINIAHSHYK